MLSRAREPDVRRYCASFVAHAIARSATGQVGARALADLINEHFSEQPSTRDIIISRRELDAVLESVRLFERVGDAWRLRDGNVVSDGYNRISPIRPGATLTLHPWQGEALSAWRENGCRGIIEAVTGAGKTRIGIAAIAHHIAARSARAAVIVPTIELMEQWVAELRKLLAVPIGSVGGGNREDFSDCAVIVYVARSAADVMLQDVARAGAERVLLVADECHRYGSDTYARGINVSVAATLGLSATPEREHDTGLERHVVPSIGPVIYRYDHDRAVGDAVVSDFRMLFVGVPYAGFEQSRDDALSEQIAKCRAILVADYPFLERATPFIDAVKSLAGRDENATARRFLALCSERRRLLHGARTRLDFVVWLAERGCLNNKRTLIFHETIADCELLASELRRLGVPALAHHSELGADERSTALVRFSGGGISALVAPRTLDEGIDVPDASLAIIVAGTRVKRQTVQRIGRVLRLAPEKAAARVVKVFIHGAGDDPTIVSADDFSKSLLSSGRSTVAAWPHERDGIQRFFGADRFGNF